MHRRWFALLGVAVLLLAGNRLRAQEGKSADWELKVVSAQKDPQLPQAVRIPPGHWLLVLRLQFTYTGPAGKVMSPRVAAVGSTGKEFWSTSDITVSGQDPSGADAIVWLLSSASKKPKTKNLATGAQFGQPWIQYFCVIPSTESQLSLKFADVPAIPLVIEGQKP